MVFKEEEYVQRGKSLLQIFPQQRITPEYIVLCIIFPAYLMSHYADNGLGFIPPFFAAN